MADDRLDPRYDDPDATRAGVDDPRTDGALRRDAETRHGADARGDAETRVLPRDDARVAEDRRVVDDDRRVDAVADDRSTLREDVVAREREEFGGMKFGSAFFGWLAAMGTAVLLTALAAAVGAGVSLGTGTSMGEATDAAGENPAAVGILGAIVLGVLLLVSYFAGGYVAGRMARFNGAKQGFAVWLWAIVVAVVVAVVTAIAGSQWDILAMFNGFPRIPVTPETATTTGILTAVGAAIVTLVGAVLGGLAGMRYHRRVDRVGLGA
ncbi:hypothetical protein E3O41_11250 [Microbacterium sediminis]|nr:hypothetical protein E3O41_11250 [Microbacterium sediminis]